MINEKEIARRLEEGQISLPPAIFQVSDRADRYRCRSSGRHHLDFLGGAKGGIRRRVQSHVDAQNHPRGDVSS